MIQSCIDKVRELHSLGSSLVERRRSAYISSINFLASMVPFHAPADFLNASNLCFEETSVMVIVISFPSSMSIVSRGLMTPLEYLALTVFPIFSPPMICKCFLLPRCNSCSTEFHFRQKEAPCQLSAKASPQKMIGSIIGWN